MLIDVYPIANTKDIVCNTGFASVILNPKANKLVKAIFKSSIVYAIAK